MQLSSLHIMKISGMSIMGIGPFSLLYRYLYVGASYNELTIGSLVFLMGGSFLWFMGWED